MALRGATEGEVERTIRSAPWTPVKHGRFPATKWFGDTRRPPYTGKDIRPIFVVEPTQIAVVTVYVYWNQRTHEEEAP